MIENPAAALNNAFSRGAVDQIVAIGDRLALASAAIRGTRKSPVMYATGPNLR